jgi:hypothetical protein
VLFAIFMQVRLIISMMIARLLFAICLSIGLVNTASAEEVDLELVLAMDASGSISEKDYILQLEGTAAAFRDPEIQAAIASGPLGRIAVIILLWSDASFEKVDTGWFLLDSPQSANIFATSILRFQVNEDGSIAGGIGGGTGIGAGVGAALNLLNGNKYKGLRRVIDISGDGIETEFDFSKGLMIRDARIIADREKVTINGLPILNENFPNLDRYYRKEVIVGPGAFVEVADGFKDFGRAIKQKLLREISSNLASLPGNKNQQYAKAAVHSR